MPLVYWKAKYKLCDSTKEIYWSARNNGVYIKKQESKKLVSKQGSNSNSQLETMKQVDKNNELITNP